MSEYEIKPSVIKDIKDDAEKFKGDTNDRFKRADETMRLVIIVLLFMLGGIVITTSLWVVQSFISAQKPQINYNITLPTNPKSLYNE